MKGRLWQPCRIGTMELKNRAVMPPMVTQYADVEGYVTERQKNYYQARARGNVGLIIVEASYIHRSGQILANQPAISDDKFILGMSHLVEVIQKSGAKAAIQIHHGGRLALSKLTGLQSVAPSPLAAPGYEQPKELTISEIKDIIILFAEAALRAKQAGFDGVEIHGAHGYLIDQFLSRFSNKREDEYGGDLCNRAKLLIEVISTVRDAVGENFPLWCRIDARQYGLEEATTLKEAQAIAKMAEDASSNAIHITSFGPLSPPNITTPKFQTAVIADLSAGIKKAVTVPVIAVGRFTTESAENILNEDNADLIAIGKGMLADPDLFKKAASGRAGDITPCIVCMRCLDDLSNPDFEGITCSVNASLGREKDDEITTTEHSREVLVIGGGPAGMEAARVAALRGHRVTLWERKSKLGGQLIQAAIPPHKDRIERLTAYLEIQLKKLGVSVELGREATANMIIGFKPDVVVLATGVKSFIPDIPGIEKARIVQAVDVLEGKEKVGDPVVVIGGEVVGCETAEFLAEQGKNVTVTRRGKQMAMGAGFRLRPFFLSRLKEKGIFLLTSVKYNEINQEGLVITTNEGKKQTIRANTIVLAAGAVPEKQLLSDIDGKVPELYLAGDCIKEGTIRTAIADAYRIGSTI